MLVLGLGLGLGLDSSDSDTKVADICTQMEFVPLGYLFERILAVPASSATVERVFSNSGLIVRPGVHIVRKCQTSCWSHWSLPSVLSSVDCCELVMGNVRGVANFVIIVIFLGVYCLTFFFVNCH